MGSFGRRRHDRRATQRGSGRVGRPRFEPGQHRTAYACAIGLALRLNDLKSLRVLDVHLGPDHPSPHVAVTVAKSERFHRIPVFTRSREGEPWRALRSSQCPRACAHRPDVSREEVDLVERLRQSSRHDGWVPEEDAEEGRAS